MRASSKRWACSTWRTTEALAAIFPLTLIVGLHDAPARKWKTPAGATVVFVNDRPLFVRESDDHAWYDLTYRATSPLRAVTIAAIERLPYEETPS